MLCRLLRVSLPWPGRASISDLLNPGHHWSGLCLCVTFNEGGTRNTQRVVAAARLPFGSLGRLLLAPRLSQHTAMAHTDRFVGHAWLRYFSPCARPAGPTSEVPGICAFTNEMSALFNCFRLSATCVAVTVFANGELAGGVSLCCKDGAAVAPVPRRQCVARQAGCYRGLGSSKLVPRPTCIRHSLPQIVLAPEPGSIVLQWCWDLRPPNVQAQTAAPPSRCPC